MALGAKGFSTSCAVALALAGTGPAAGEIVAAAPDGFHLHHVITTPAAADVVWAALINVGGWWNGAHTYSGDATNLTLAPEAGGCWCETWDAGSVEHGRVLAALPGRLLRVEGGFGPLQGLGVGAVMNFEITPADEGATLTVDYAVTGAEISSLDAYSGPVDAVLGEQIGRLADRLSGAGDRGE